MKCALFPCEGMGDCLITLVLAHNLSLQGHTVHTYHPFMAQMQELFPHLPLFPRSHSFDLGSYDRIFVFYEKHAWMQGVLKEALEKHREKTTVLNPIATPNRDYPFWEEGNFDGTQTFVDNLVQFCHDKLGIAHPVKSNGIQLPSWVEKKKYPNRVIIHPTSSRPGKNWTKEKFLKLADQLKKKGLEPVFILTKEEQKEWPEVDAPVFENLVALAHFVAESIYMIGNDSGIGHLASCLGIPTLTICRSSLTAHFWKPAWTEGALIVPPKWIPNLKGLRWRDHKWQMFISVRKVLKEFYKTGDLVSPSRNPKLP